MKNPINRWRKFVFGLGYTRATFLHCIVIMPLVWLTFWLLVLCVLPMAFHAQSNITVSLIAMGSLSFLWIVPSFISGLLIWPMCRLGLSAETDDVHLEERERSQIRSGEVVGSSNGG